MIRCTDCSFISPIQRSICKKDDCIGVFCGECRNQIGSHVLCGECKKYLTCDRSGLCLWCPVVSWITPDVAIGSREALDDIAETVVDLYNYCKEGEIQKKGNVLYLGASNLFTFEELVDKVMPTLSGRILFRCKYGHEESVIFAWAYLSRKMDTEEAKHLIRSKRPRADVYHDYRLVSQLNRGLKGKKLHEYHASKFMQACFDQNVEQIRKLAPTVDITKEKFNRKSPIYASLNAKGATEAVELLLSLGAVLTPRDAYHIFSMIGVDFDISYLDFFENKGYDIRKLQAEFKGPFLEEDEDTDDDE